MTWLSYGLALMVLLAPAVVAGQAPDAPIDSPPFVVAQGPGAFPGPPPPGGPHGMREMPGGPGPWWKDSEIVRALQLSEPQISRIEQVYLDHRLRLVDLRGELEKQELRLQPLLDADRPDEGKVTAQIDGITGARGRLEKERAMMLLAIRQVLSTEQWKQLQSVQRERDPRRHPGPAGFPPPGAPPRPR